MQATGSRPTSQHFSTYGPQRVRPGAPSRSAASNDRRRPSQIGALEIDLIGESREKTKRRGAPGPTDTGMLTRFHQYAGNQRRRWWRRPRVALGLGGLQTTIRLIRVGRRSVSLNLTGLSSTSDGRSQRHGHVREQDLRPLLMIASEGFPWSHPRQKSPLYTTADTVHT